MGRTANTAVAAKWRERINRWKQSTLSISAFCRREQVSQPSFFQWRKRLDRKRAVGCAEPRFVELSPAAWPTASGVQIALPSGAVVTLPAQASTEVVTTVIRAAMFAGPEDRPC